MRNLYVIYGDKSNGIKSINVLRRPGAATVSNPAGMFYTFEEISG